MESIDLTVGWLWWHTPSIKMIDEIMEQRMFPLTIKGLEEGIRKLT